MVIWTVFTLQVEKTAYIAFFTLNVGKTPCVFTSPLLLLDILVDGSKQWTQVSLPVNKLENAPLLNFDTDTRIYLLDVIKRMRYPSGSDTLDV